MWDVIEGFLAFQFNFWTRFPFSDISLLNGDFGRQMKGMSRTDLENVPSGVSGCAFSPGAEEPRQKWAAILYHLSCPLSSRSPEHLSHLPHLRLHARAGGGASISHLHIALQFNGGAFKVTEPSSRLLVRVEKVTLKQPRCFKFTLQHENCKHCKPRKAHSCLKTWMLLFPFKVCAGNNAAA